MQETIDVFIDTIQYNEDDKSSSILCICPLCGNTISELKVKGNEKTITCITCGLMSLDNVEREMALDGYVN